MEFYYDAEFDALRKSGGWTQCLISIGIIASENGVVRDSFYSLIQPKNFRRLTRVVKEMTHLNDEDILLAPSFAYIMAQAEVFFLRYMDDTSALYCFGPDDKRTIAGHAQYENVLYPTIFDQSVDLQKSVSRKITWQDRMVSPALSLDDLKCVYGIAGEVEHNARNDALDLMRIHEASRYGTPIKQKVKEIYEYKQQRLLEGRKRQYEQRMKMLHQRYDPYDGMEKKIVFYPDVIDKLKSLSKRGDTGGVFFEQNGIMVKGMLSFYDQIVVTLQWHMKDKPYISFHYYTHSCNWIEQIPLTNRNGEVFHAIWRMIS